MGNRKYITFHYKNLLVSKFKTKDPDDLMKLGNQLILNGLKNNKPLELQKKVIRAKVKRGKQITLARLNKYKVSSSDHNHFVGCFLGLMKLKELEEDDANGFIITKI